MNGTVGTNDAYQDQLAAKDTTIILLTITTTISVVTALYCAVRQQAWWSLPKGRRLLNHIKQFEMSDPQKTAKDAPSL